MKLFINAMILCFSSFSFARVPVAIQSESLDPATKAVIYRGGPVISHVKVHVVYWNSGVPAARKQRLENFYKALVNSDYMDQLSEYSVGNQKIGRGELASATEIKAFNSSKKLTQSDVEKELESQVAAGKLPAPDADALYMIHYPDNYSINISFGLSCREWIADHEDFNSTKFGHFHYAVFPCDNSFSMDMTIAASHELEEAVTDPISPLANQPNVAPAAWINDKGEEIGDLCIYYQSDLKSGTDTFAVEPAWLNSLGGCSKKNFTAAP